MATSWDSLTVKHRQQQAKSKRRMAEELSVASFLGPESRVHCGLSSVEQKWASTCNKCKLFPRARGFCTQSISNVLGGSREAKPI